MSEISQITAGTETYSLKDTTARSAASGAVKNVNGKSPNNAGQVTLTLTDIDAENLLMKSRKYFTDIPANADLNNYKTAGCYACGDTGRAQNLVNCPVKVAFRMTVINMIGTNNEFSTWTNMMQIVIPWNDLSGVKWRFIRATNDVNTVTYTDWADLVPVTSVNGKTGVVQLTATDVGAMTDDYTAPVTSVNDKTGAVELTASDVGALADDYTPPVTSVNSKTGAVDIKLDPYPVGAIYISVNNTSPASLFGGTWEVINDRFLLAGSAKNYKYGSTGGAATVTLTKDQMPQHQHQFSRIPITSNELTTGNNYFTERSTTSGKLVNQNTETQGNTKAHNNMPPYLSVYMWKRTA